MAIYRSPLHQEIQTGEAANDVAHHVNDRARLSPSDLTLATSSPESVYNYKFHVKRPTPLTRKKINPFDNLTQEIN